MNAALMKLSPRWSSGFEGYVVQYLNSWKLTQDHLPFTL